MLAPSQVPKIRLPFIANFMLEVPEASVPAVLMCWDSSAPAHGVCTCVCVCVYVCVCAMFDCTCVMFVYVYVWLCVFACVC